MLKADLVRVRHMPDAARDAIAFSTNKTRRDLDTEIPWAVIVAMRNRLIHAYYDVDLDRVWDTVTSDLPPLILSLENLLKKVNEPA